MATSSIFENVVISTPEAAEAFVRALEESTKALENEDKPKIDYKIATREDIIRLTNMRKQKREAQTGEACH